MGAAVGGSGTVVHTLPPHKLAQGLHDKLSTPKSFETQEEYSQACNKANERSKNLEEVVRNGAQASAYGFFIAAFPQGAAAAALGYCSVLALKP